MAKKILYRLEPLRRLKERLVKKAEMVLAKAIKELNLEKEKLERLEETRAQINEKRIKARSEMRAKIEGGKSHVKDSHFHLNFMVKLKDDEEKIDQEIKDQKETIKIAEEKLKRAKRDYMDAASEMNVMEKHKELWEKKQAHLLSEAENKMMNEIGNTVFQMNKIKNAS